jgi:hypothetical protein
MRGKFLYLMAGLFTLVMLVGCGGDAATVDNTTESKPEELAEPAAEMDYGEAILADYHAALTEMNQLLADKPAAEDVLDDLNALKAKYVERLVGYGKVIIEMPEADAKAVSLKVRMGLSSVPEEIFDVYSENHQHYFDSVAEDVVLSFNIITQYAFFDLLKEQFPEEAARLGIQ